jgi:hypothetical protein
MENREHPKNGSVKVKDPDVEDALHQWFSIITGRGVRVSGPMLKKNSEELAKNLGHDDFKQQMVGCLNGNVGMMINSRKHIAKKIVLML